MAVRCSSKAHWATKHNSATVATDRPTMTLDSRESTRTMRGMSYTGNTERNAQPNTYTADNSNCTRAGESAAASITGAARVTATADSEQRAKFSTAIARSRTCQPLTAFGVVPPGGGAQGRVPARVGLLAEFILLSLTIAHGQVCSARCAELRK